MQLRPSSLLLSALLALTTIFSTCLFPPTLRCTRGCVTSLRARQRQCKYLGPTKLRGGVTANNSGTIQETEKYSEELRELENMLIEQKLGGEFSTADNKESAERHYVEVTTDPGLLELSRRSSNHSRRLGKLANDEHFSEDDGIEQDDGTENEERVYERIRQRIFERSQDSSESQFGAGKLTTGLAELSTILDEGIDTQYVLNKKYGENSSESLAHAHSLAKQVQSFKNSTIQLLTGFIPQPNTPSKIRMPSLSEISKKYGELLEGENKTESLLKLLDGEAEMGRLLQNSSHLTASKVTRHDKEMQEAKGH